MVHLPEPLSTTDRETETQRGDIFCSLLCPSSTPGDSQGFTYIFFNSKMQESIFTRIT